MKNKSIANKIAIIIVAIGFIFVAVMVIDHAHLLEDPGTLDENVTIAVPEGYEVDPSRTTNEIKYLVRETDKSRETLEIEFYGFDDYSNTGGEKFQIDDETKANLFLYDWDHDIDNSMNCYVMHGDKCYDVTYQYQDKTRKEYYNSCTKHQQDELMEFITGFQYHAPPAASGNVFARTIRGLGVSGCVVFGLAILIFVGMPVAMAIGGVMGSGEEDNAKAGQPLRSSDLHEQMNRERREKGEAELPSINTVQGTSTNNLARRDHSWSSVPDFFVKLVRGNKKDPSADGR